MIEITNLTKIYPNQKGVRNINFSVGKGEIVGLLGPNGAGKTTIMRMITGYLYPTDGTIKVGDADIFEDPLGVRRQIGYLPENPPVYPEMSVDGYLKHVARLKKVAKANLNAEVSRVMELTQIGDVRRQLIGSLSKGYKQRVGLAQALLNSPPVLILDEPSVGLDPKQIIEIRNLIKSLAQEYTVILSSHIIPEVNMICGRVVIISHGNLVAVDTPEGLAQQLAGGQRVEFEAKGAQAEVEKLLKSMTGVEKWSHLGAHTTGSGDATSRFQIESQAKTDIREALFKTFAGSKIPLLEMRSVNLSLEEIFLQLTTTDSDEAGANTEVAAEAETEKAGAN
ncbi:MAG TPA: ABC transporter ATP-binding protein [Bacillota bacterium]|nr:ABC transporter ATP-binding protein [Bacillota bacterium]